MVLRLCCTSSRSRKHVPPHQAGSQDVTRFCFALHLSLHSTLLTRFTPFLTLSSGFSLSYQQSESCRALSPSRARPTFATDDDTRESTIPSSLFPPVTNGKLIPVTSIELSATSSARARPTFATDDDTRESTMPSGFSPSYQQRAVEHFPQHERDQRLQQMMTPERVRCLLAFPQLPTSNELSGTFLCTSETNVCNR
jgi:hypothetical protein